MYHDIVEELMFGGAHVLHTGDKVKWVPLSGGSCDDWDSRGLNNPRMVRGELGMGKDGWGPLVATFRLSALGSPYALCTMESSQGAKEFTYQPHVLAHVYYSPSPPPMPPAIPPPWNIIRGAILAGETLAGAVPDVPEEVVVKLAGPISFVQTLFKICGYLLLSCAPAAAPRTQRGLSRRLSRLFARRRCHGVAPTASLPRLLPRGFSPAASRPPLLAAPSRRI